MDSVRNLREVITNFLFPYSYLREPGFEVSRNLMPWDRMVMNIS
jgi:hypothetical protein